MLPSLNGNHLPISMDKALLSVESLEYFAVGQTQSFDITAPSFKKEEINVCITGNIT